MEHQERLDKLEQLILVVAGEIKIHSFMVGDPAGTLDKNVSRLGEMLQEVMELKKELGCTSDLRFVEKDS